MRIHINHPTPETLLTRARTASGATYDRRKQFNSRSHDTGYDIILSGESGRHMNSGSYGARTDSESATWDQWGIFLAVIFDADPTARCGSTQHPNYADAEDFHVKTGGRYERCASGDAVVLSQDSPDYKITAHRWQYDPAVSRPWSGEGTYYCKGHGTAKNKRAECHATMGQG